VLIERGHADANEFRYAEPVAPLTFTGEAVLAN